MSAIPNEQMSPTQFFASSVSEATYGGASKRNTVFLTCVLLLHAVAAYALIHARLHTRTASAPPIEVEFIAEKPKTEETPKFTQPATIHNNVFVPSAPAIETFESDVTVTTVASSVPVSTTTEPQSTGENLSPRLISDVEYVRAPKPKYPSAARAMRLQGTVVLRVLIDRSGRAAQVLIHRSSGHKVLDEAAQRAASEALFKPYFENGAPREVFVLVPIEFGQSG